MNQIDQTISTIASLLGARGGKARTDKKIEAARKNARKARLVRKLKLQQRST